MSTYSDRLKNLGKQWKTTKPHSGGTLHLPAGTYQVVCRKAKTQVATYGGENTKGKLHAELRFEVVSGDLTGRQFNKQQNLEWVGSPDQPTGLARFFGDMATMQVATPKSLNANTMKLMLEACIGVVVEIGCVHKGEYVNYYINRLIDGGEESATDADEDPDLELEEEEEEELADEEVEEAEDDEEEEEEEETEEAVEVTTDDTEWEEGEEEEEEEEEAPPPPVSKKKTSKKKAGKKKKKTAKKAAAADEDDPW